MNKTAVKNSVSESKQDSRNMEIQKASQIASFYGFMKSPDFEIEKQDTQKSKEFRDSMTKEFAPFVNGKSNFDSLVEERIAFMRNFIEKKFTSLPQPVSVFYESPVKGNPYVHKSTKEKHFSFEILGNAKSIADATIIETAYIILSELYPKKELSLFINSVGDKESITKFTREITNYYKKNWDAVPQHCKALFKKDIFELVGCKDPSCQILLEEAPKSINFLSDISRKHFKEVLEYIEMLNLGYTLDHALLGNRALGSGMIFEIRDMEDGSVLAFGERYNCMSKKAWGKKEIPAIGAVLKLSHTSESLKLQKLPAKSKYSFYLLQLSYDAKLKSLSVIEILRKAKVPVHQSLSKDKFSGQIAQAEKLNCTHLLIIGKKEAMENSVVVRHIVTRSQETVSIENLADHIKNL